ncbi:Major intrinsic protein [Dioscorea alata]|uniref:Major intrinsic protein n=1 Tax=Dioscorea alata TaxID=55571 RepID=A0ACB7WUS8_DIOAL|nr:Major intrinsic protein [Dioscorea alata]
MPRRRIILGRRNEAVHPDTVRATVAEFIATAIFVFAAEGSVLSLVKMEMDTWTESGLLVVAVAHGLAFTVAVAGAMNLSGGHVNPAVTLSLMITGRISVVRAVLYWVAQLLGAVAASLLLRLSTADMRPVGLWVAPGFGVWNAVLLEIILTFGLVYTFFAIMVDLRNALSSIEPLAVGFIIAANILVGGVFDGAGMNPARVFGPALIGWQWRHHWVYWLGPFIGSALAALIYEFLVMPFEVIPHTLNPPLIPPLIPEDY